jgi:hypothetical protein
VSKICTKCGVLKPLSLYPRMQGGYRPRCKPCHTEDSLRWQRANRERFLSRLREWYNKNKRNPRILLSAEEKKLRKAADSKQWREKNKERFDEMRRNWSANNKHVMREVVRRRQIAKRKASPEWANRFFIQEAYHLAELRTEATGYLWAVDHIVPIISPIVCGLHVEHNLQVIPQIDNVRKGNRAWPSMP